jgi:acetyl-CoA/propionyl-CoA carboxylase biotin carboxyl carrier protein
VHTGWVEHDLPVPGTGTDPAAVAVRVGRRLLPVALPGLAQLGARAAAIRAESAALRAGGAGAADAPAVTAPMRGTIVAVAVTDGDHVAVGDLIAVCEAMKMENPVRARRAGVVTGLTVTVGDPVDQGSLLCEIRS